MAFQAEVATWLAAHVLTRLPIGGRFGLSNSALPEVIRMETGEGLDDILVLQNDGSRIELQCKTRAGLTEHGSSPLGKTIAQLAGSVSAAKTAGALPDPSKAKSVLAVTAAASRSLDHLERACRAFEVGGGWLSTKAERNGDERYALDLFEAHARAGWAGATTMKPDDGDLVAMARLFRIVRFSMDEGDDNWREASRALGGRLYGSETSGDAPLRDLKDVIRDLIRNGAPADRAGLLRALRQRGHRDVGAPDHDADLVRLYQETGSELERLSGHTRLPIAGGIPIRRECAAPLAAAVAGGSLIVIGEPGAGKTGSLVALAAGLRDSGGTVVFLSVDRFPGVATAADLQSELRLEHPLVDVLAATPGTSRKILFVDALDATRGGPAEEVFARLIEEVVTSLGSEWTIVVSIRTFDLRNGIRYRKTIPGSPPDPAFAASDLAHVCHFQVPRLTDVDIENAGDGAVELGSLLAAAPDELRGLLHNVFNLSLAAQLLTDGVPSESIRTVATQSDLIDVYEDHRLVGTPLRQAAAAAVDAMVRRRRMTVRKVVVANEHLDEVVRSGVLSDAGDLVSFAHHVLFDHVAGRFHLEWDEPRSLIGQLRGDSSTALMLAPGLRFAIERLWRIDDAGKPVVWRCIVNIYADEAVDTVLANVALRTAIERVRTTDDVGGIVQLMSDRTVEATLAIMLSRLARFVGLAADGAGFLSAEAAVAWASIAEAALKTGSRTMSDAARFLLHTVYDRNALSHPELLAVYGRAARRLLDQAWAADPPMPHTANQAIRFVGRSFGSDAAASRALLSRALRDPHFSEHADKEAIWLSEQIIPIAQADPDFAVEIVRVLHSQDIADESTSYFGGVPSRILPLSSNRKQDYHASRYDLGTRIGRLLELSARTGTRAVVEVAIGEAVREVFGDDVAGRVRVKGRATFHLRGRDRGFGVWDERSGSEVGRSDDVLGHFVEFLRTCSRSAFEQSVEAGASEYSSPAIWARFLGVGAERAVEVSDLLWPFACSSDLLAHRDTVRDAVRFLGAAYPTRSFEDRIAFEIEALKEDMFTDDVEGRRWQWMLGWFLSATDESVLVTDAMRKLRADLAAAGELQTNAPLRSTTMIRASTDQVTRELLSREGVDVVAGVDAQMLARTQALRELVRQPSLPGEVAVLANLWDATEAVIAFSDAHADDLNERLDPLIREHVSDALRRIAESDAYMPGSNGMPQIEVFLVLLRSMWTEAHPELADQCGEIDDASGRGNTDVRTNVAEVYVSLADRFGEEQGEIIDAFDAVLADPVPNVRLRAAENLQVLSRIASERMWRLAEGIASGEQDERILGAFLDGPILQLTWQDPRRCEDIVEAVIARKVIDERSESAGRDGVATALGRIAAQLWVGQARTKAFNWLGEWAEDPVGHRDLLTSFLAMLRSAFFARYASDEARNPQIADRAQSAGMIILEACSATAAESRAVIKAEVVGTDASEAAIVRYRAAEQVVRHFMNELHFGSGAYADRKTETPGLKGPGEMRRFLIDYRPALDMLAGSHEPATHHPLVQLYEYLIPGDPSRVFDAVHGLLINAAAREGYHHEGLASTVVVRMIGRYIAEHRSIFEDDDRRARLVETLKLFSDAGWPDALRLLYDLSELLR